MRQIKTTKNQMIDNAIRQKQEAIRWIDIYNKVALIVMLNDGKKHSKRFDKQVEEKLSVYKYASCGKEYSWIRVRAGKDYSDSGTLIVHRLDHPEFDGLSIAYYTEENKYTLKYYQEIIERIDGLICDLETEYDEIINRIVGLETAINSFESIYNKYGSSILGEGITKIDSRLYSKLSDIKDELK